jgi:hypothetical protein
MKPRNFPERRRARQIAALARLKPGHAGYAEELAALIKRIGVGNQRHVRTKKDRTATARIGR